MTACAWIETTAAADFFHHRPVILFIILIRSGKYMIRLLRFAGLALLVMSAWAVWSAPQPVSAHGSIDAAAGKKVWDAKLCKNCHGANAEGGFGPALGSLARNAKTLDDVKKQVRDPFRNMPAFSADQISDADLADLVDYIKTLPPNPDWKFAAYTPAAGEDPGKTLFNQKGCAACHGQNGERIISAAVKASGATTLTDAMVVKQVRTPAKNMPTYKTTTVSDGDLATIAPWVVKQVNAQLAAPAAATTPAPSSTGGAPTTLPKSGGELPQVPWALLAAVSGLLCLGASVVLRRRALR
jgi:mono/diheme cytochrome c family protein